MAQQPSRRWLSIFLSVTVLGFGVLVTAIVAYGVYIRTSAAAIVNTARQIRSTADAEREIGAWRSRSGPKFWDESSHLGGDYVYDAQIENGLLSRLHIVEPTAVGLSVTMNSGKLRCVTLVMFTGRKPSTTSGVWIQEWFESGSSTALRVNDKNKPWKATVEFSSLVSQGERERVFALNTKCFVQPKGCKSAEEILPDVWRLATPLTSRLHARANP